MSEVTMTPLPKDMINTNDDVEIDHNDIYCAYYNTHDKVSLIDSPEEQGRDGERGIGLARRALKSLKDIGADVVTSPTKKLLHRGRASPKKNPDYYDEKQQDRRMKLQSNPSGMPLLCLADSTEQDNASYGKSSSKSLNTGATSSVSTATNSWHCDTIGSTSQTSSYRSYNNLSPNRNKLSSHSKNDSPYTHDKLQLHKNSVPLSPKRGNVSPIRKHPSPRRATLSHISPHRSNATPTTTTTTSLKKDSSYHPPVALQPMYPITPSSSPRARSGHSNQTSSSARRLDRREQERGNYNLCNSPGDNAILQRRNKKSSSHKSLRASPHSMTRHSKQSDVSSPRDILIENVFRYSNTEIVMDGNEEDSRVTKKSRSKRISPRRIRSPGRSKTSGSNQSNDDQQEKSFNLQRQKRLPNHPSLKDRSERVGRSVSPKKGTSSPRKDGPSGSTKASQSTEPLPVNTKKKSKNLKTTNLTIGAHDLQQNEQYAQLSLEQQELVLSLAATIAQGYGIETHPNSFKVRSSLIQHSSSYFCKEQQQETQLTNSKPFETESNQSNRRTRQLRKSPGMRARQQSEKTIQQSNVQARKVSTRNKTKRNQQMNTVENSTVSEHYSLEEDNQYDVQYVPDNGSHEDSYGGTESAEYCDNEGEDFGEGEVEEDNDKAENEVYFDNNQNSHDDNFESEEEEYENDLNEADLSPENDFTSKDNLYDDEMNQSYVSNGSFDPFCSDINDYIDPKDFSDQCTDLKSDRNEQKSSDNVYHGSGTNPSRLYEYARQCNWSKVSSECKTNGRDARYVSDRDGGYTALHLAVISRCNPRAFYQSYDGNDDIMPAPLSVIEELILACPEAAIIRCSRKRYTPLVYACSVPSLKCRYDMRDAATIVKMILNHSPHSSMVYTDECFSALDVHIISYSRRVHQKENDNNNYLSRTSSMGPSSTFVVRALLEANPALVEAKSYKDGVRGPIELLYRCNLQEFKQRSGEEKLTKRDQKIDLQSKSYHCSTVCSMLGEWWAWKWTLLFLNYSFRFQSSDGDKVPFSALHAAAKIVACPVAVLLLAVEIYPKQIEERCAKDNLYNLPLHDVSSWVSNKEIICGDPFILRRKEKAIELLLEVYPKAARMTNNCGATPLQLAIESCTPWDKGLAILVQYCPNALKFPRKSVDFDNKRKSSAEGKSEESESTCSDDDDDDLNQTNDLEGMYPYMVAAALSHVPKSLRNAPPAIGMLSDDFYSKERAERDYQNALDTKDLDSLRAIYGLLRAKPEALEKYLDTEERHRLEKERGKQSGSREQVSKNDFDENDEESSDFESSGSSTDSFFDDATSESDQ